MVLSISDLGIPITGAVLQGYEPAHRTLDHGGSETLSFRASLPDPFITMTELRLQGHTMFPGSGLKGHIILQEAGAQRPHLSVLDFATQVLNTEVFGPSRPVGLLCSSPFQALPAEEAAAPEANLGISSTVYSLPQKHLLFMEF